MNAARILIGKHRTINPEHDNQARLQHNISAQANAARVDLDRKDLQEARRRLTALESRMCIVDARAMDSLINRMFEIVERCENEAKCPALPDGVGAWDDIEVN